MYNILERFLHQKNGFAMKSIITFLILLEASVITIAQNYGSWSETDSMNIVREGHAIVLLPDSTILVSGNDADSIQSSCEIYDISTGKWHNINPMKVPRTLHQMVLLSTGKILVIGGLFERSCELFDPQTETWTMTDSLPSSRNWGGFTTTVLQDSRILVVGGLTQDSLGTPFIFSDRCEMYDPITEKWDIVASINIGRDNHRATILNDGKVLITGGEISGSTTNQCEIYDPTLNTWEIVAQMNERRSLHAVILLKNGNVFISGGSNGDSPLLNSCEVYDVSTNEWVLAADMSVYRKDHHIYYLTKIDKLLILGGGTLDFGEDTWEIYDPNSLESLYYEAFPINQLLEYNNVQLPNENIFVAGGWEFIYTPLPAFFPGKRSWIFDITTDIPEKEVKNIKDFYLEQNYPNPFNPGTSIQYTVSSRQFITLKVYDMLGREVATLVNEEEPAGNYEVEFDGSNLPSGMYIYKIQAGEFSDAKKMLLLK